MARGPKSQVGRDNDRTKDAKAARIRKLNDLRKCKLQECVHIRTRNANCAERTGHKITVYTYFHGHSRNEVSI